MDDRWANFDNGGDDYVAEDIYRTICDAKRFSPATASAAWRCSSARLQPRAAARSPPSSTLAFLKKRPWCLFAADVAPEP